MENGKWKIGGESQAAGGGQEEKGSYSVSFCLLPAAICPLFDNVLGFRETGTA